jgi:hypothetical protein
VARSSSSVSEMTTFRSETSFSLLATVICSDIFNLVVTVNRDSTEYPLLGHEINSNGYLFEVVINNQRA